MANIPKQRRSPKAWRLRQLIDGYANTAIRHWRAAFLGRIRGIFVLVRRGRAENNDSVNTLALSESPQPTGNSRRIGFLVYPGCEILDVCGPYDVFFYADTWLTRFGRGETGYQCVLVAAAPGPVRTKCGIEIAPTHTFGELGDKLDTLIVTGGCMNVEEAREDPTLLEWVHSMGPRTRRVASICTGAFILAAAGLLDNRRVTTHWMFSELLSATFPLVQVDSGPLFCRDGNIYSSGGITAGIDLALALLEEDLGQAITLTVARTLVVFPRRPGGQSQFSAYLKWNEVGPKRADIDELQTWILGHPGEDLSVATLADRMAMSPRNFARLFHSAVGQTPARFVDRARADAARCKLEQTTLPVATIAEECGFGNAERMRRSFQRLFDVSPHDYRARFRSPALM
jgi:transcriptional regulator GlxA family with amidase domain